MDAEDRVALAALIAGQRQAALGTLAAGAPFVSLVLYALDRTATDDPSLLIHISRLSSHTRHLEADERASLLIAQPDIGAGDPQELPRVTIQALAQHVPRESGDYEQAKQTYLARLPQTAMLFGFADFKLFRLTPTEARYIGGFAKAFRLGADDLRAVLG